MQIKNLKPWAVLALLLAGGSLVLAQRNQFQNDGGQYQNQRGQSQNQRGQSGSGDHYSGVAARK